MNKKIIVTIFLIVGLVVSAYGLIQILNNLEKKFDSSESKDTIFGRDDMGNMLGLQFENSARKEKREKGWMILGIGVVIIFTGLVVSRLRKPSSPLDQSEIINKIERLGQLKKDNLITEDEFNTQKRVLLDSKKDFQFVDKPESTDYVKIASEWIARNRKFSIISGGVAVVLMLLFYFYYRDDPEREGKKSAEIFCGCEDERMEGTLKIMEKFIESFDGYDLKNRKDAYLKFYELIKPQNNKNIECTDDANTYADKQRIKYKDDKVSLKIFNDANSLQSEKCREIALPFKNEYVLATETLDSLYLSIKEPNPDPNRIMNDLIGRNITSWNFEKTNEFKTFEVKNTTLLKNKLECIVYATLNKANQWEREAELTISYRPSVDGWDFHELKTNYIAFNNGIPDVGWSRIEPLSDCSMTWDMSKKLTMKTGENSEEYLLGPDSEKKNIPPSKQYFLQSREGQPIFVKFKYYPVKGSN